MNSIFRKIFGLLLFTIIMTTCLDKTAYAELHNNIPEVVDYNYNHYVNYKYNGRDSGFNSHTVTNCDLSYVDKMRLPYCMMVERCCSNINVPKNAYLKITINGRTAYYDNNPKVVSDFIQGGVVESQEVNVKAFRSPNATIVYELNMPDMKCSSCGKTVSSKIIYAGMYFTDERAVAYGASGQKSAAAGKDVSVRYSYTENMGRVAWGIRFKGETSFTLLNEGSNRGGIVATGVNTGEVTLKAVTMAADGVELGAFVYDKDGNLPAGTSFPNTPFYTRIVVYDSDAPTIDVKKTVSTETKSVIVTITGTDNVGLHSTPYSWDGGSTFEAQNTKSFTTPGSFIVALRDSSGNVVKKEVYIDAIEIEKANPKKEDQTPGITEKESGSGSGNAPSDNTGGGNSSDNGDGQTGVVQGGQGTNPGTQQTDINSGSPGSGNFDKVKDTNSNKEYSNNDTKIIDSLKDTDSSKITNNSNSIGTAGNSAADTKSTLSPKKISEKESKDAFEKIRKNSEKYIISMRETKPEEQKAAEPKKADISLETLEDEAAVETYTNTENEIEQDYTPSKKGKSPLFFVLVGIGFILLILLLIFILFFGVIIFAEKQTEYTMLSGSEGIKVPVGISFVVFKDGKITVCFRELLNKHKIVYARFGVLFNYLYENDKVSIMTRFKGEKKREIATEIIHREIIVGSKGGNKR